MKKSIKQYKQIIWSKRVMGSIVVVGALISGVVFGLNGYFGGGEQGVPEDTMTRGLVAYYSFDEGSGQTAYNAADTGSANDGTLGSSAFVDSADPTWGLTPKLRGQTPSGPSGSALDFDGSNDYVNCGSDQSLDLKTFTIEFWIKVNSASENILFQKGTYNLNGWYISETGTNKLCWNLYNGSSGLSSCSEVNVYDMGVWTHVVMVIEGNASRTWYKNGSLNYAETSTKAWVIDDVHDFIIGKYIESGGYEFNGSIDDVKIYNRVLSASEVRYHYNRGGPVAHWRFDEGEGQVVYDSTDNNNDGTLGATSASASDDPSWVAGKHNSALEFDGVDDYVSIPDDDSLDITDAITIEAWMKPIVDGLTKKPITITGSGSQEINYQVKVDVTYDSDMQADFDDIRFADSDGATEIDHWRESYVASTSAVFWVEVPTIPTGGTTIYMYYGNSSASSASSLANTFTSGSFTDTFADETKINTGASSNIAVSGGEVKLAASSSAYATPVADSASASREFNSDYSSDKAINDNTADLWLAVTSAATTDWIKFAIADDTYTTPVSADASRTLSNDIASYGAQLAIDENTGTNWYGPSGSGTDWARFVIANDTYTTPSAASASTFFSATYAPGKAIDENTASTQWLASTSGSVTDWIKFDLGSIMAVDGCRIMQGDNNFNTETVKIESSDDDANWTVLYSGAGLIGEQWKYFNWTSANMRYIKVSVTDPGSNYPRIQEFDYRKTSDNAGNVSVKGVRIWAGKKHTINISYSTTDDEDASYTNLKTGVVLAGTSYGWNYYAWTAQDLKYIRVSVTALGGETHPMIYEFDYRTGDEIAVTNGCRIYGDYGNDTVTISISTTDSEDSAFSSVLTGQTVIDGQWNEFSWSVQDTKYIKVAITATAQYPAMAEFDAKKLTYYSSGSLISVTIPENTSTRFAVGTQLSWNDTEPTNTDAKYQLQYYNGTWQLIPDADLSGNSIGFDTSPKDISSVKTGYGQIRLKGSLSTTDTSVSPSIQDYTVTHYYRKYASPEPTATVGAGTTTGISKAGAYAIGANTTTAFVSINDQTISGTISSGWNHIALTYDKDAGGTQEMKLFANGIKLSTNDYSTAITSNSSNLFIGDLAGFNGSIDDVRIYDYARTPDEIRLDYNAGFAAKFGASGKTCSEDPASCMDNGLVASYDFDEGDGQTLYNAADTGSVNNGTLGSSAGADTNDPKWTSEGGGRASSSGGDPPSPGALQFDGTDDYVNCGNDPSLDITDAITIEAWVKPTSTPGALASIVGKEGKNQYWLNQNLDDTLKFYVGNVEVYSNTALTTNAWNHVVTTYDTSDDVVYFYLNGSGDGSTVAGNMTSSASDHVYIGIDPRDTDGYDFNGIIDGVKIYNRALSAEEVRYHYNRGGPVAHWRMDEGEGSTAYDSTDNNNDGTLHLGSSGNTATSTAWVAGRYGTALEFDGEDDYVNCGSIGNGKTISFWLNPDSTTESIFEEVDDTGVTIASGTMTYPSWDNCYVDGIDTNTITTGWHHIVLTSTSNVTITAFRLGLVNTIYFDGIIDDVKIYNYARSPDEIRLDYNAGYAARFGPAGKTCSQDPASCMDNGLVASYDFDEGDGQTLYNAATTGTANNGTLGSSAGVDTSDPSWIYRDRNAVGSSSGALQFDGTNDYVDIGDISEASVKTVELWAKPDAVNATEDPLDLNGTQYVKITSGTVSGQGFTSPTVYVDGLAETTVTAAWHHIVITTNTGFSASDVDIGRLNTTYFNGLIDEVRIYNRALTASEVRYHYNRGGPVSHWKFDEGEGSTLYDETSNNNDGTLHLGTGGNTATSTAWVSGKHGTALDFDGTDDYVNCGSIGNGKTIAFWLNPDSTTESIFEEVDNTGVTIASGTMTYPSWDNCYVDGIDTNTVTTGWHHIVLTSTSNVTITAFRLGLVNTTYFDGIIDDVRIYNYARTPAQIQMDYNAGFGAHLK